MMIPASYVFRDHYLRADRETVAPGAAAMPPNRQDRPNGAPSGRYVAALLGGLAGGLMTLGALLA